MHQNAPFIPLNIKNRLPKEGGTPLLQPPPPHVLQLLMLATPFPPILPKFPSILKLIYIPAFVYRRPNRVTDRHRYSCLGGLECKQIVTMFVKRLQTRKQILNIEQSLD